MVNSGTVDFKIIGFASIVNAQIHTSKTTNEIPWIIDLGASYHMSLNSLNF